MIHVVVPILLENQNENQRQMRTIMDSNKVRQSYEYLGSLNNAGSRLQTTAPEDRPDTEEIEQYLIYNQYIATRLFDNAIVGTSPDIEAKEGQTALEVCLEQIQDGISSNI